MKVFYFMMRIVLAVSTTCLASPVYYLEPTAGHKSPAILSKRKDHCDLSTFYDNTTSDSPLAGDCSWFIDRLNVDHYVMFNFFTELLKHKTCSFVATATVRDGWIGTSDIEEILMKALIKFQRPVDDDIRMASSGRINCEGTYIDWSIERSK